MSSPKNIFEPVYDAEGKPTVITQTFPANQVFVVYYSNNGKWASFRPFPLQRKNLALVYAPGISQLAVCGCTLPAVDYYSDALTECTVSAYLYADGETFRVPETIEQALARHKADGEWVDFPTEAHQS